MDEGTILPPEDTKRFLICYPTTGSVGTFRGNTAEVREWLLDMAVFGIDPFDDLAHDGQIGHDIHIGHFVVIRQA